ncbi:MAG: MFS transporter [Dehalococcoidia bacterium]|nr:MFS transporter [Dehalococcoidia bacterium]
MEKRTVPNVSRESRPASRYRWVILTIIVMAQVGIVMAGMAVTPLAPFVLGDLVSSRTELGMLVSALLVGAGIGSMPGGWLSDRSVRWTLAGGQALLASMVIVLSQVTSFQVSLALLFLGGIGYGAVTAAATKAVAAWFTTRERALAMGLMVSSGPMGSAIMSLVLPPLGQAWGWRPALLPFTGLVLVSTLSCAALFRSPPTDHAPGGEISHVKLGVWDILKKRETWLLSGSAMLMGCMEHAFRTYFLLHLTEVTLLSVIVGGWYLALSHGSGLFGRVGWGLVADRWFRGDRAGLFAVLPLMAGTALLLLGLGWGSPWILPLLAIIFGLAGGGWVGVWSLILLDRANTKSAGTEIGLVMSFTYVGVVLGPILFGRGVDLTGSYQTTWMVFSAIAIPASACALLLRRSRRKTGDLVASSPVGLPRTSEREA